MSNPTHAGPFGPGSGTHRKLALLSTTPVSNWCLSRFSLRTHAVDMLVRHYFTLTQYTKINRYKNQKRYSKLPVLIERGEVLLSNHYINTRKTPQKRVSPGIFKSMQIPNGGANGTLMRGGRAHAPAVTSTASHRCCP